MEKKRPIMAILFFMWLIVSFSMLISACTLGNMNVIMFILRLWGVLSILLVVGQFLYIMGNVSALTIKGKKIGILVGILIVGIITYSIIFISQREDIIRFLIDTVLPVSVLLITVIGCLAALIMLLISYYKKYKMSKKCTHKVEGTCIDIEKERVWGSRHVHIRYYCTYEYYIDFKKYTYKDKEPYLTFFTIPSLQMKKNLYINPNDYNEVLRWDSIPHIIIHNLVLWFIFGSFVAACSYLLVNRFIFGL